MSNIIRIVTAKLVSKIIYPLTESGLVEYTEYQEINKQLKHLAEKGNLYPPVIPKLINQKEAADMLSIGLSNFKKLEAEESFPFKRKMVGSSVRYRNIEIVNYIES